MPNIKISTKCICFFNL